VAEILAVLPEPVRAAIIGPGMAATLRYFMLPEDERAFLRLLGRSEIDVYPELVPPGYRPFRAGEGAQERLDGPAWYLAAERFGDVMVHPVKRGPGKGMLEIEEVPSPVFHYQRSLPNEAGELVGGRLWAELEVTDGPGSSRGKPLGLRRLFEEIQAFFRKSWRRSDPKGHWIGPHAAAAFRSDGLVLREPGHRGGTVRPWR
jgi:hypothetical protein